MRVKIFLLAALMSYSLSAAAGLRAAVDAYEVALEDLILPQGPNGNVSITECESCERPLRFRVTNRTVYVANDKNYTLADYRRLLATVRDREGSYLTVVHDRETNTVTSIRVKLYSAD